jgi:phage shock protein C
VSAADRLAEREPRDGRLFKDAERRVFFGVCAGIADYFGFSVTVVRAVVAAAAFFLPVVVVVYVALGLLLPKRPGSSARHAGGVERGTRSATDGRADELRRRLAGLDMRVRRLEKRVTSRFELEREFEDLKD